MAKSSNAHEELKAQETPFDVAAWCDLARGLADPDQEPAMRERLEQDAVARRTVELLSRVKAVADADMQAPIPAYAVRIAKAAAAIRRPATAAIPDASGWRFLSFEVLFDSLTQPLMAGTRDMQASHRQVAFQAGDYHLDLRWDREVEPGHLAAGRSALVGQLLNLAEPMAETPVMVIANGEVLDRSVTSELGEFHAEGLPNQTLSLYVLVDDHACLAVTLDDDDDLDDF